MARYVFDKKEPFLKKLEELVKSGIPKRKITTFTPYPVHETEHLLDESQSPVRFFTAFGGLSGLVAGFAFTIFTVFDWPTPMITGGKPYVSIPAFLIIAYELTILFGCLTAFVGFLYLARVPVIQNLFESKAEFSRQFEIEVDQ
ncbi:MAG: DUF3341 domain-containing protein [Candidatus Krumholzibacteriia bacterium]